MEPGNSTCVERKSGKSLIRVDSGAIGPEESDDLVASVGKASRAIDASAMLMPAAIPSWHERRQSGQVLERIKASRKQARQNEWPHKSDVGSCIVSLHMAHSSKLASSASNSVSSCIATIVLDRLFAETFPAYSFYVLIVYATTI